MRLGKLILLLAIILCWSQAARAQSSASVVKVGSGEPVYKIPKGSSAPIVVTIDIEPGYHINSNRPADKYLIATALKLDRAAGISASLITYPKAKLKKFSFSPKPLSVYEGHVELRFNARALSAAGGPQTIRGKLTVQACNDEACLRPQTIDVTLQIEVM